MLKAHLGISIILNFEEFVKWLKSQKREEEKKRLKMLIKKLLSILALFVALLIVQSIAAPSKYSSPKLIRNVPKKIRPNQLVDDQIADIFEIPVPETSEVIKKCTNIVCMHYTLCVDDTVLTDGSDLFELRLSMRSDIDPAANRIVCDDFEMPCCADQALTEAERKQEDEIPKIPKTIDDIDADHDLDYGSDESISKCGHMIGDNLEKKEHQWIVNLYLRSPMNPFEHYIGSGSLIQPAVILTAAHGITTRMIQPEMLVVRAGDHASNAKRQERNVTNIIIHDKLNVTLLINDIALIVADSPFELSDYVNTICLPPPNIQTNGGIMCTASRRKNDFQAAAFERFELPIVDRNQCENRFRQTRLGRFFILNPSLMCAGGLGFETCEGDMGSPLLCKIPHLEDRFYQTGIMVGGLGCDSYPKNTPGVFVNVAHVADWIKQQLRYIGHSLDPVNVLTHKYFD